MKRKKKPFAEKRQGQVFTPPVEYKWENLKDVLALLTHPNFYWGAHNDFLDLKYLELRIDTRDLHCIVKDRNSKIVDFKKVMETLDNIDPNCREMNENKS